MSTTSYREFSSRIQKGHLDRSYLFSGRDEDRKREAIEHLESALRRLSEGSIATIKVRSDEVAPEELAAGLFTIPLFEKYKLILIPDIEALKAPSRDLILDFLQAPPAGIYLLATTSLASWEFARKAQAFFKVLEGHVVHVDFPPPREDELRDRAWDLAETLGYRIEREALDRVLIMAGYDSALVRREMEKLSLFIPVGGVAGLAEVEAVVSRGGEVDVWGLAEALSRREAGRVQRILRDLLSAGERPVQIVGALWYHMVRLAWCRSLLDSGVDEEEIGKRLKVKKWQLRSFIDKARGFTREEYHAVLRILFDLDVAVRSRGRDVEPIFSIGMAEAVSGIGERKKGGRAP